MWLSHDLGGTRLFTGAWFPGLVDAVFRNALECPKRSNVGLVATVLRMGNDVSKQDRAVIVDGAGILYFVLGPQYVS